MRYFNRFLQLALLVSLLVVLAVGILFKLTTMLIMLVFFFLIYLTIKAMSQ